MRNDNRTSFGHPNSARYLTYQNVTISTLCISNSKAWEDLRMDGFGGIISGEPFSSKHGDLIIETTINRDVKVRGGPMQGRYSIDSNATNTFVTTTHLMAKLRAALKQKLHLLTSSKHKEMSLSSIQFHEPTIQQLVTTLQNFLNQFSDIPAMHMKSGEVIDEKVVGGLLRYIETGESLKKTFIEERLTTTGSECVSIFKPIKNQMIETGLKIFKMYAKVINVLKKEKYAFGILVGKSTTAVEAHSHSLTSVPFALALPNGDLRQSSKSPFRNHLMEEGNAVEYFMDYLIDDNCTLTESFPINADWIVDGMSAMHSMAARNTWKEFADAFLAFCIPPACTYTKSIAIVMDMYGKNCIKEKQKMPAFNDWGNFLCNGENKTPVISFLPN